MFSMLLLMMTIPARFGYTSWKRRINCWKGFKEFKALVENLSEKKIKILRSDNGWDFTSNEFNECCKEVGIKREHIVPYNPQQNGVT